MESSKITVPPCRRLDFDGFCLLPEQHLLLRDETPVRIGARAVDILIALASQPGELLTKDELIAKVWPNTCVDRVNLRATMAALRKALGDTDGRLISTDTGRGYRFTADLGRAAKVPPPGAAAATETRRLPSSMTRLIGRDDFVASLGEQLPHRRLITVVGPGGIGKTRVAIACAEALAGSYRDGVCFIDLTAVTEPASIAATLAAALGVTAEGVATASNDPLRDVLQFLPGRAMLLVMDNCEHVVDAAASLAEAITMRASGVHILATSRESLRAAGEWVRALPPLRCPPIVANLSAADALSYPAVELFVERVADARGGFQLSNAEAPVASEICGRLEGVALAIELAAAQADVVGLACLAARLDDRLWLLNSGRRTVVRRHQTLAALHDWSYRLLSEQERATLWRVALLPGEFTLAEAIAAGSGDDIDETEVIDAFSGLVSKSLAMLDTSGPVTRFRLPETTRAYAFTRSQLPQPATRPAAMPATH
jgi:predicted ATPase/DNA-binding winged helix-turn-helix (wHTH) protein